MNITNQEFKNCVYSSELEKSIINLMYTNNIISYQINELLKVHNLTKPQYNALRIIDERYPDAYSANEIKMRMLEKNSDISRILGRLSQKQLIKTYRSKQDKRSVKIKLSDQGIDLLRNIKKSIKSFELKFGHISDSELKELNRLLYKIRMHSSIVTNSN